MGEAQERMSTCFAWWKRLRKLFRRRKRPKKSRCIADDKQAISEESQDSKVKEKDNEKNRVLEENQGEGAMDEGEKEDMAIREKQEEENVEEVIHIEKGNDEVVKREIEKERVVVVIHSEEERQVKMEKEKVEEVIHLEEVVKEEIEEEKVEKKDQEEGSVVAEDEGLSLASLCVSGNVPAAEEEGWTRVRRRKRKPKGKEALPGVVQAKASSGEAPRPPAKAKPRKARRLRQQMVSSVKASWQDKVTEVEVPVEPQMRRHIVGPSGATLRELLREFDGVSVAVPPPRDAVTRTVTLRGPPLQVSSAAERVQSLLLDAEVIEMQVEVAPEQRCHVVGPGGVTVRKLRGQFPDVAVIVPAPGNRVARIVRLKGPRRQVIGAQAFIQACLEAALAAHATPCHIRPTTNRHARTHAHGPSCHTAHHPSHQ
ncbi:Dynein heavy chain-like protein [Portunus trituberculatus]|uniref:Dynein heavy chain-like protein n=1 Tax=Portunus trituberculatus TaxID=210409 RepID=A0A5B7GYI7_PORTR|nr:Dynein heavy chain-like protein [Portunus trituberculatus]